MCMVQTQGAWGGILKAETQDTHIQAPEEMGMNLPSSASQFYLGPTEDGPLYSSCLFKCCFPPDPTSQTCPEMLLYQLSGIPQFCQVGT